MSDEVVRWTRRPYTITYQDLKGEKHTIRRVPPPRLHDMLPTDIVELTRQKNEDFVVGDEFDVKHINPRHPNVLQLTNDDEITTFVDYYDLDLVEEVADRPGVNHFDKPINNRYLMWP
jgi:hypothetical protein